MPLHKNSDNPLLQVLGSVELFKRLPPDALEALSGKILSSSFYAGELIIRKDDAGDSMFIILDGSVKVHDGNVVVATLGEGKYFGEMSLLNNEPRSMSVSAIHDSKMGMIRGEDFFRVMKEYPDAMHDVIAVLSTRLRNQNSAVINELRSREAELKRQVEERTKELREQKEIAEQMRERAEQSEKFKQQFLANMSHEIRTPMNSIIGLTRLLINSPLNDQQKKYLNVIEKSSENLLVIINDILDLAKIQAGKMTFEKIPFSIEEVLETVYHTLLFKSQEKKIELSYSLGKSVPKTFLGDPTRLNQILINIIGNAIKFTEQGGVKISVDASPDEKQLSICNFQFAITDTGIGMTPEQLSKIFESFSQASTETTRKYGGTGLGLTISKQLIEMQGGTLSVASEVGKGTTFTVKISYPVSNESETEKKDSDTSANAAADLSGVRILLVEDNEFNQMVAVDTLEELIKDIKIDVAENGQIALDKIQAEDYVLALMDIQMPVMDGFECTRKIRALDSSKKNIPIMAMTANVTKEEIEKCFQAGMDDYITKPFNPENLLAKMQALSKGRK